MLSITEAAVQPARSPALAENLQISEKPASASRFACVDLLRTIAILTTVGRHLSSSGVTNAPHNWLAPIFNNGGYGVIIFFAVSGFVISYTTAARDKNLCNINLKTFYQNRVARILPLLFLIVGLGIFFRECAPFGKAYACAGVFNNPNERYDWQFWLSIPTFWFNWVRVGRGADFGLHWDVMWTLSIEEQFYVLFPLVLLLSKRTRNFAAVLALVIAIGPFARLAKYLFHPANAAAGAINSVGSFDQIAIGCVTFLLWTKYHDQLKARPKLQWALTICGGTIAALTYYFVSPFILFPDRVYGPTLLALGVGMFILGALGLRIFEKLPKFVLAPGYLSYGMYLYQAIALYFSYNLLVNQKLYVALPTYILVDFCIAWVSFNFFELPINKRFRAKKPKAAA